MQMRVERCRGLLDERMPRYARNALAFGCGYLVAGTVLSAYASWVSGAWNGRQSPAPQFQFVESLIFVFMFGAVAATSYLVGAVIRGARVGVTGYTSAGRAALFGAGCSVGLWILALRVPTSRAVVLVFLTMIPGCFGYLAGRRDR
jgi:hypothetical protein